MLLVINFSHSSLEIFELFSVCLILAKYWNFNVFYYVLYFAEVSLETTMTKCYVAGNRQFQTLFQTFLRSKHVTLKHNWNDIQDWCPSNFNIYSIHIVYIVYILCIYCILFNIILNIKCFILSILYHAKLIVETT